MSYIQTTTTPWKRLDCEHKQFRSEVSVHRSDAGQLTVTLKMWCAECTRELTFLQPGSADQIQFPVFVKE